MDKKNKICFAVSGFSNNGVTRVLSILLDNIDTKKYDISVLLTKPSQIEMNISKAISVEQITYDNKIKIINKIKSLIKIRKFFKRKKFDKVIVLGNYASMYVLISTLGIKIKKIISERNDPNREPSRKIYRILRNIIYKTADIIVCQTTDSANYYKNIVKETRIIMNPIKDNLPYASKKKSNYIVNFCRIDSQKNLKLLIDSFNDFCIDFPEYFLKIYGNGPLELEIKKYINQTKMKNNIELNDFCSDIHEKIKDASMFVSTSDFEGMSNSMLEAMAMGIPTICTDCPIGGAHTVINNNVNGILVECNNKNELVNAMKKVASDNVFSELISKESIKIRQSLDKNKICAC